MNIKFLWIGILSSLFNCESNSSQNIPAEPHPVTTIGLLKADGLTTNTYKLICEAGYNYETPDLSNEHANDPFQHIQQSFDNNLNQYVFDFHIHIDIDDDRGLPNIKDRQRNEIKTDGKSPKSLVAQEGERFKYTWKFKLPEGMLTTKNFCHIHQIKGIDNADGNADVGMPMITFTTRSVSDKQEFQVIYVAPSNESTGNVYLKKVDLGPFLGNWVGVEEDIIFGSQGSYQLKIFDLKTKEDLLVIPPQKLNLWREGTTGMRPKWGIYRSFGKDGSLKSSLRDEVLRFADFQISSDK